MNYGCKYQTCISFLGKFRKKSNERFRGVVLWCTNTKENNV